jgi:hypothetical protein
MPRLALAAAVALLGVASAGLLTSGLDATLQERSPVPDVLVPLPLPGTDGETAGRPGTDLDALPAASGLRFGIDAASVQRFTAAAGAPDYATLWVGKWNLDLGWRDTDLALQALRAANVTPAIHFYYWGDDIRPDCFTVGCNGKDAAGWDRLHGQLVEHVRATMGDAPVLILLESEFNKHGLHDSEDLDARLADKATALRYWLPNADVVLALGNWRPDTWGTWDRAAAASDYVGIQALAGSTRDGRDKQVGLADATLKGVERLRDLYAKPVIVQDVAVSSYPEPDHLETQAEALLRFAERMPDLRDAGVEAVIYRSYVDVPDMNTANHYREAERHWGLAWHDTGELKPGGEAWVKAVQKAREPPPADEAVPAGVAAP